MLIWGYLDGLAGVKRGSNWEFIDTSANVVIRLIKGQPILFQNGISRISIDKKVLGYINKKGDEYWEN